MQNIKYAEGFSFKHENIKKLDMQGRRISSMKSSADLKKCLHAHLTLIMFEGKRYSMQEWEHE